MLFLAGFLVGRCTTDIEPTITTKYIQLDPVHDTVEIPQPKEHYPIDTCDIIGYCIKNELYTELWPRYTDTTFVPTKVDTMAILYDWVKIRDYDETLFDIDTLGKCDIHLQIQHNRLQELDYSYIPIQKEIITTIKKVNNFEPFISFGVISNPSIMGEVGCYFKQHYGIAGIYEYDTYQNKHCFGGKISYKF